MTPIQYDPELVERKRQFAHGHYVEIERYGEGFSDWQLNFCERTGSGKPCEACSYLNEGGYEELVGEDLSGNEAQKMLISGLVIGTKIRVVYWLRGVVSHTQDGDEYDTEIEIEYYKVVRPVDWLDAGIFYAEQIVKSGGFCVNCHWMLVGATLFARENKLCDQCAKRHLDKVIGRAKDPLYDLRMSAYGQAGNSWISRPPWEHDPWREKIRLATTEAELRELIHETEAASYQQYRQWLAYQ